MTRESTSIFSEFETALLSGSASDIAPLLTPDAVFEDAFFQKPHRDGKHIAQLLATQLSCTPRRELIDTYRNSALAAFYLHQHIRGQHVEAMVVARLNAAGTLIQEIRYFARRFAVLTLWRDACKTALRNVIPEEAWVPPAITPDDGTLLPMKKTFPYAENLVFHSPIMLQPCVGREHAEHVLQRAGSVYGIRQYTPESIDKSERNKLTFWDGAVGGVHPVHSTQILKWNEKKELEFIKAFFRPWEVTQGFVVAMRERLRGDVSEAWFDLEAKADAA